MFFGDFCGVFFDSIFESFHVFNRNKKSQINIFKKNQKIHNDSRKRALIDIIYC